MQASARATDPIVSVTGAECSPSINIKGLEASFSEARNSAIAEFRVDITTCTERSAE